MTESAPDAVGTPVNPATNATSQAKEQPAQVGITAALEKATKAAVVGSDWIPHLGALVCQVWRSNVGAHARYVARRWNPIHISDDNVCDADHRCGIYTAQTFGRAKCGTEQAEGSVAQTSGSRLGRCGNSSRFDFMPANVGRVPIDRWPRAGTGGALRIDGAGRCVSYCLLHLVKG